MPNSAHTVQRFFNPGWLKDEHAIATFAIRHELLALLLGELERVARHGSARHHVLIGATGSGKSTVLNRLAVEIRRSRSTHGHLIPLLFGEGLYQIKSLADFWWAGCESLYEALEDLGEHTAATRVQSAMRSRPGGLVADSVDDAGLRVLLETCAQIRMRPVLLVDRFDSILARVAKQGRRLTDPASPSYSSLRSVLTAADAPVVVAAANRFSDGFTRPGGALCDIFDQQHLGALSFGEVCALLERLADLEGAPELRESLHTRRGRLRALYELIGSSPRAVGLSFDLLRQEANARTIEQLQWVLDMVTPYHKGELAEISEQAQTVLHGLALLNRWARAVEVAHQTGLPTRTVSAQLDILERKGMVEKKVGRDRTRFCVADQSLRIWIRMRTSAHARESIACLAEFLESLYGSRAAAISERERWALSNLASSLKQRDWDGISAMLAQLTHWDRSELNAFLSGSFVEDIAGPALREGIAGRFLDLLREARLDKLAAPLVVAIETHVPGLSRSLEDAPTEVRRGAEVLSARLTSSIEGF